MNREPPPPQTSGRLTLPGNEDGPRLVKVDARLHRDDRPTPSWAAQGQRKVASLNAGFERIGLQLPGPTRRRSCGRSGLA